MSESRKLPNWIDAYMEYTKESEPPELFRKWCAVSVVAAALQRKCRLRWGASINFYPNMYIVLVAPAGKARKGTAMAPARKLLESIEIPRVAEAVTREALIRTIKNAETTTLSNNPSKPPIVHSSVTVFSPELTVFLGYNNLQLMSDLTDWFDCAERWAYRTKTQGTDDIHGIFVNLIGATTPDLLRSTLSLDAIGGGLTSRIIFVYEEKKGKIVPYPMPSEREKELEDLLRYDLERIFQLQGDFKFTNEFLSLWGEWYLAQEGRSPFGGFSPHALDGYIERRPTQVLKLSMIMSAAKSNSLVLTDKDLQEAIFLLEQTEVKMPRTFGGVGAAENARLTYIIFEYLSTEPRTVKDILNHFMYEGTHDEITACLSSLSSAGLIELATVGNTQVYRKRIV